MGSRGRATRTLAVTARSQCGRDGGGFARLGRAGSPRSRGCDWGRPGNWLAPSMDPSGRVPECCEAFRARLLRDSAYRRGRWRHNGRWAGLEHAGRRSGGASHRRAIGSCTPFGFLRDDVHQDCRRRELVGDRLRSSNWSHLVLARCTAHSFVSPGCMGREMQRSRGKLCTVPSRLRGGRTRRFES